MKIKDDDTGNDGPGGKDSSNLTDQGISTNKPKEKANEDENKNDQNGKIKV